MQASIEQGAKLICGGAISTKGDQYYSPTVLDHVSNQMPVAYEEVFGPVAPIIRFTLESEAIRIATDTEYGLASYFYSNDLSRVWRVAEALDYGMVGINEGIISNPAAPFGGVKQSGYGREGSLFGLDDYTNIKYLCMGLS